MKEYHYYDQDGNVTITPEQNDEIRKHACCLQIVSDENPGNPHVYIKMDSSGFFDPQQKANYKSKLRIWKFKHVRKQSFDLYLRYLKTKHHHLFVNAVRNS